MDIINNGAPEELPSWEEVADQKKMKLAPSKKIVEKNEINMEIPEPRAINRSGNISLNKINKQLNKLDEEINKVKSKINKKSLLE
ncbi:hypothetical protein J4468_01810 [Candidatus Woesearchaeota archaeon]|nr:hypothetical protein [Candidatus Woesearchaeota archaeon]